MGLPAARRDATCLITGASSGLGAAFARLFSARGRHVTLVARRRDRLDALAQELRARGGTADLAVCDLADAACRAELITTLREGARTVDVLVNNAGFGTLGGYAAGITEREREMLEVNVAAPVALCRAFVPGMAERRSGAVLNVSSIAAFQPLPGMSTYAATKAMTLSFSAGLHAELAGQGVTVTVMCPGAIRSEFASVAGGAGLAERLPGWLWMTPEAVAADGLRGLERGRWLVVPGRHNQIAGAVGRHVPRSLLLGTARLAVRRLRASGQAPPAGRTGRRDSFGDGPAPMRVGTPWTDGA